MKYKGYTRWSSSTMMQKFFRGKLRTPWMWSLPECNAKELEKEFHKSWTNTWSSCGEMKRIPEKPFSGKLLLRLTPSLHRKLYIDAIDKGESLNHHIKKCSIRHKGSCAWCQRSIREVLIHAKLLLARRYQRLSCLRHKHHVSHEDFPDVNELLKPSPKLCCGWIMIARRDASNHYKI